MNATGALFEGLRRALRAPGLVLALWAANWIIAVPLAVFMLESIHSFTARSSYNEALLEGFDTGWFAEFTEAGGAIEESLTPSHIGVGAWLSNLDRWWDGRVFLENPWLLATGALFVVLWLFVLGGVIESLREGAPRPRLASVLGDGVDFFPRLLRLGVLTATGYYAIFRFVRWLFPKIQAMTIDVTSESWVLFANLAAATVVVLLITLVRVVSDYAKISMVVERRRSALLSLVRGLRFVVGQPLRVMAIAGMFGGLMFLLFLGYHILSPGAGDSTPLTILTALAIGQVFLVAKQALRIAFLASEVAFFEVPG